MTPWTTVRWSLRIPFTGMSSLTPFIVLTLAFIPPRIGDTSSLPAQPKHTAVSVTASAFAFTPNAGQMPADVLFMMQGGAGQLLLTDSGFRVTVMAPQASADRRAHLKHRDTPLATGHTITIQPIGATLGSAVALDRLPGRVSYLLGSDPKRWRAVFRLMNGYGEWVQLSVFQCRLSRKHHAEMLATLDEIVSQKDDHVVVIDVGIAENVTPGVVSLGKRAFEVVQREPVIV